MGTQVYDDDVVLHYTDAGTNTVSRVISTLPGKWSKKHGRAKCSAPNVYCIGNPYGFGWAITGFAAGENQGTAMPASLHIDPWKSETDTRSGDKPEALTGTLTVTGLTAESKYDIYRWDSVEEAFSDYTDKYKRTSFTATNSTFVYADDKTFVSNGATYY